MSGLVANQKKTEMFSVVPMGEPNQESLIMDLVEEVMRQVPAQPLAKGKLTGKLPGLAIYKLGNEDLSRRNLKIR